MLALLTAAAMAGQTQGSTEVVAERPEPALPGADAGDRPSTHIINGDDATRDDWPMSGALILNGEASFNGTSIGDQTAVICSSTLIAPDVVLLAAHCVDPRPIELQLQGTGLELDNIEFWWSRQPNLSAYLLGSIPPNLPEDAVRASSFVMHPEFDLFTMQLGLALNHDIALVFLEQPVLDVPLGVVPQPDTAEVELEVDDEVVVVGWGQQTQSQPGQQPSPGSVGVKKMGTSHVERQREFEFQVGGAPLDVRKCHGDSGGPTFKQVETDSSNTWRVIGVTSHTYDQTDCVMTGGVDTRVSYFLDWIDAEMRAGCETGARVWCDEPGILPPPLPDGALPWEVLPEEEEKRGCGCGSAPTPLGALAFVPFLAAVRRRR